MLIMLKKLKQSLKKGIDGIGLYRSEYLFMNKKRIPSEQEQFKSIRKTLKYLKGKLSHNKNARCW